MTALPKLYLLATSIQIKLGMSEMPLRNEGRQRICVPITLSNSFIQYDSVGRRWYIIEL